MSSIRRKIFGLIFAIGVIVTLPYVVFGAERIATISGRLGEQQTVILQVQAVPTFESIESREPATKRVYVQPRWVDGGYGVLLSVPGNWTGPNRARKR